MPNTIALARLAAMALCLAAGVAVSTLAGAQTPSRAPSSVYLPDASTDSMLVVVELRHTAAIEFDRDVAARKRFAAETREATARIFQSRAETTIKLKDAEISALKARVDQAKSEEDGLHRQQLEREREIAEVEKKLLQRREQLRQRDIELAEAEVEYYAAEVEAYDLELELARGRAGRARVADGVPSQEQFVAAWQRDKQIRELEGTTLDAMLNAADKQKKLAEKAVDILQARKKVWEAQRVLIDSVANLE